MALHVTVNFRHSWVTFAIVLAFVSATVFLSPQLQGSSTFQTQQSAGAWLDRPLVNWNKQSTELPRPAASIDQQEIQTRCPNLLRQADSPFEHELVAAGWLLYGALQSFGTTKVVTAMSGTDNECRPLGYQAFVYFGDSYAGTLSPATMDSLTNGALTTIRLSSANNISAEFARYTENDSPCCPRRMSYVTYEVSTDEPRRIGPVEIITKRLYADTLVSEIPATDAARLFEVKWRLTEVNGVALTKDNPYLRFEGAAKIWSANGGCNKVAGRFEIDGTSLTILSSASTKMACLDADAQQLETYFLNALSHVTRFELTDNSLRLYDCDTLLLVFHPDVRAKKTP
jgi:heat shock protein HslJ